MKIFVYTFQTNYGPATFVIAARTRKHADKMADDRGAWDTETVTEINPNTLASGILVEEWPMPR